MRLPEVLETNRLRLKRLSYEDAEEIFYGYASKPEATRYVSWPTHRTLRDTRSFLSYAVQGWKNGVDFSYGMRSKVSNRFVGSFGIIHQNGKVQFGYVINPSHWGQGLATEACRFMMELLKTVPDLYRVGTFVDVDNVASSRVLLKAGLIEEARLKWWFRFVNQDNQVKDCILYRLPM